MTMPKRKVNLEALRTVVEAIIASGRVINGQALAELIGVDKATISRSLRKLRVEIPVDNSGWRSQRSGDDEPRTHAEIARLFREAIAAEPREKPYADVELCQICNLNLKERNARKIRTEAGIGSSWQRRRSYQQLKRKE
jgi:hypothetical protein